MKKISILFFLIMATLLGAAPVHTTYLWHLQQPIYWPDKSEWNSFQYQSCWESQYLKLNNGNWYSDGQQHPLNNLEEIFGNDDRKAVYQYRAKDAVASLLSHADAGAQVNYSGCLIKNVNSLANAGQWGYYSGWENNFQEARNWQTSGGNPRMDIVSFTFHHALAPLIDENALHKEIQAHRYIYEQTFGTGYSKGFWPAECSFSERIIQTLVEEGLEWTIIANSHLARTCQDYPLDYGTSGCNIDPPNGADILGPNGVNWWNGQIDGRGGTFSAPFSYQAHKAKYVDPETGEEFKITAVPMSDLLSYQNGYGTMGTGEIDAHIAPFNDPDQPSIVLMAHDGDNAWGGGYDYYMNSVSGFANAAANQGYVPSTIQQFLDNNPVPENDVVHIEDGSWVNAANDWGHPQFINWIWPMYDGNRQFDPDGWTEDVRNWAVITAAENRVETAENLVGNVDIAEIVYPNSNSNNGELAWHHFLPSLTSGYMYYGTAIDMEVKQTLACNNATDFADLEINAHPTVDNVAPSIFIPQRFPYNPGGKGFGPIYGYQEYDNPSDFFVWTFAYDVSDIQTIEVKYRIDNDGFNPLNNNENETYLGGAGVGGWQSISMTERIFPIDNNTGNPEIDFFILPNYIANEYYAEITGLTNCLVDYYIEATDNLGNLKKTPIQHVYVGEGGGEIPEYVVWEPESPAVGDEFIIHYGEGGELFNASTLMLHLGVNGWQNVDNYEMNFDAENSCWNYSFTIENNVEIIDFCFTDGNNNWDNNNGSDWHISVTGGSSSQFVMDGEIDESAEQVLSNDDLFLYLDYNGSELYFAVPPAQSLQNDVFVFISENPTEMITAPWSKSGEVANWNLYLANESTNNWCGWFDASASPSSAIGTVLEGCFSVESEIGVTDSIYLAIGKYETADNGELTGQIPVGNGDLNIDIAEYYSYYLDNSIIYGDVDGNGEIQAFDASLTLHNVVGLVDFTETQITAADVDGNGHIQAFDASLILQYVVGLIDSFPIE